MILAFDGDVARKPKAAKALCALADYLKFRGPRSSYLHLPDEDAKVGLDDFLMADGHTVEDLWKLVKTEPAADTGPAPGRAATTPGEPGRPATRAVAGEQPTDTENGSRFFGRSGLLARDLADAVMASVTCGFGYPDQRFYIYDNGVWLPDDGRIEGGDHPAAGQPVPQRAHPHRARPDPHSPGTARITDNPLADYVNVPNGMVAWKTGDLLAHSPDYRSTVQLPVAYDPNANCPLFEKFIAEVLPPDLYEPTGDSLGFIWELIGYTLYSGNPLHVAVLLYGKGRNGKGTLIRVLKALLGDRNCSTVGLHQLVENRFRAATLFGKLANLAGDLDSNWLDNTAMFKAITGGDTVQAEHKYGARVRLHPVGAAVLLDQQGVRLGRLLGGLGGALGGGAVPDELHRPRGPDTGRQAAVRRRASWHPAPRHRGAAGADGARPVRRAGVAAGGQGRVRRRVRRGAGLAGRVLRARPRRRGPRAGSFTTPTATTPSTTARRCSARASSTTGWSRSTASTRPSGRASAGSPGSGWRPRCSTGCRCAGTKMRRQGRRRCKRCKFPSLFYIPNTCRAGKKS